MNQRQDQHKLLIFNAQAHRKLSATVHDFSGTIMHALLPKAYS